MNNYNEVKIKRESNIGMLWREREQALLLQSFNEVASWPFFGHRHESKQNTRIFLLTKNENFPYCSTPTHPICS